MKVEIELDKQDLSEILRNFALKKCRRLFGGGKFDLAIINDPLPNSINLSIAGHAWPEDNPELDDAGEPQ